MDSNRFASPIYPQPYYLSCVECQFRVAPLYRHCFRCPLMSDATKSHCQLATLTTYTHRLSFSKKQQKNQKMNPIFNQLKCEQTVQPFQQQIRSPCILSNQCEKISFHIELKLCRSAGRKFRIYYHAVNEERVQFDGNQS